MKEVKRRSAIPVYIAAAVYALYALIFPLYKLSHFLIAALVTAAAWLIADHFIKPIVEYVPVSEPEPEPVSYGETVDAILAEAKRAHDEMLRLSASIGDGGISQKITQLISLSDRIARDAIDDPNDIRQIQKFQSYFLPSTIGLLNAYDRMSAQDMEGTNLTQTKEKISQMLDTEVTAFKKQLDALYENDAMNIDTDIQVMQKLLEREGLLERDELHELLKKAQGKTSS
jgi:hypothetical protein